MSYCRYSSDNFHSDVYAYEDCHGGYTLHIAAERRVGHIPDLPDITQVSIEEFQQAYQRRDAAMNQLPMEPINLPHSGETMNYATLRELHEALLDLRELGYRVPESTLAIIAYELEGDDDGGHHE